MGELPPLIHLGEPAECPPCEPCDFALKGSDVMNEILGVIFDSTHPVVASGVSRSDWIARKKEHIGLTIGTRGPAYVFTASVNLSFLDSDMFKRLYYMTVGTTAPADNHINLFEQSITEFGATKAAPAFLYVLMKVGVMKEFSLIVTLQNLRPTKKEQIDVEFEGDLFLWLDKRCNVEGSYTDKNIDRSRFVLALREHVPGFKSSQDAFNAIKDYTGTETFQNLCNGCTQLKQKIREKIWSRLEERPVDLTDVARSLTVAQAKMQELMNQATTQAQ